MPPDMACMLAVSVTLHLRVSDMVQGTVAEQCTCLPSFCLVAVGDWQSAYLTAQCGQLMHPGMQDLHLSSVQKALWLWPRTRCAF